MCTYIKSFGAFLFRLLPADSVLHISACMFITLKSWKEPEKETAFEYKLKTTSS